MILNQTTITILRFVSILCIFTFLRTFGPMGIPLRTPATTKEKKKKKKEHGLFSMYELQKIKIMAPKDLVHTRSISS